MTHRRRLAPDDHARCLCSVQALQTLQVNQAGLAGIKPEQRGLSRSITRGRRTWIAAEGIVRRSENPRRIGRIQSASRVTQDDYGGRAERLRDPRAVLIETAVWLDCNQAEEPQSVCLDRTAWLLGFLKHHPGELDRIEVALAEQREFHGESINARLTSHHCRATGWLWATHLAVWAIALRIASFTPIGRIENSSKAFVSRTKVGFFNPSIKCRPTS